MRKSLSKISAQAILIILGLVLYSSSFAQSDSPFLYGIKSGEVTYKISMMGISSTVTSYFDEYGKKEATKSKAAAKMMGMTINKESLTISKDGYIYTVDLTTNTGTKMKVSDQVDYKNFDIKQLDGAMAKQFEQAMENAPTSKFLGKECKVVTLKDTKNNTTTKVWLWENIALKYIATTPMGKYEMAASKIEEKAIPASTFEIPAGVSFKTIDQATMNEQLKMLQQLQNGQ